MKNGVESPVVEFFSARRAAKLVGMTLAMVNYLCRNELVIPSGATERGRGRPRLYSYADVLLLRVMAQLLKQGVSISGLKTSLAAYRDRGEQLALATCRYFVTDGYNVLLQDVDRLEDLTSGQQVFAFVLDLQPVREAVDKSMEQARTTAVG